MSGSNLTIPDRPARSVTDRRTGETNTIDEEIKRWSGIQPDWPALVLSGFPAFSYRRLQNLIDETRTGLRAAGLSQRARIALAFPNGPHTALAIVAVTCCCVAAPLDPKLTPDEIGSRLAILQPDAILLLHGTGSSARIAAARYGLRVLEFIPDPEGEFGLRLIAPSGETNTPADEPCSDRQAFILQTSGTTGEPTAIPFTHRNMLAASARLKEWFTLTPRDRCLSVSPLCYSHGLKVTVFTPLLTGGTVVFPSDANHFDFSEWFVRLEPTWYSASPTVHRFVLDRIMSRADAVTGHTLRFALSGGAPLPGNVQDSLSDILGVPVVEHYGSTEAAQISANSLRPDGARQGTCGRPWPETVMIADENGSPVPNGERGEILLRGATVTSGYLGAPELNKRSFVGGWFRTGDIGSFDEGGFLSLHGRSKDLINRGGEKIWPVEIDKALMRHPAVAEAAAFPVPHSRLGEDIAAAVELNYGMTATPLELRQYLSKRLASFKVPRRIIIVEQLPRGLTGKVLRRQLSESFGKAEVQPTISQKIDHDDLLDQLKDVWQRLLGKSPSTIDDDFFELGGDSLLAVSLLSEVERITGRRIPASSLFESATLRRLRETIHQADDVQASPFVETPSTTNEAPLIYFHGDKYGGTYVRKLARLLQRRLLVVPPHGLDNDPVPRSIEAMAADRLPMILAAQPTGPYRLGGYCLGGLVAFEVARMLVARGQKVEFVAMVDPPAANARPFVRTVLSTMARLRLLHRGFSELMMARTWFHMARLESYIGRFVNLPERWTLAAGKARKILYSTGRGIVRVILPKPEEAGRKNFLRKDYSIAMSVYLPKPLSVPVIFFSASYSGEPWRRISADLEVIKLSGGHYGVPTDPSDFACHLRTRLQALEVLTGSEVF